MTTAKLWDVGENITIDLLILDPATALGLTGQASNITLRIRRSSDNKFWTGSAWSSTASSVSVTESDATNEPGRYVYTLLGSTGNTQADRYFVHSRISNAPTIEGDDIELHISKDLTVRVYEAEPV